MKMYILPLLTCVVSSTSFAAYQQDTNYDRNPASTQGYTQGSVQDSRMYRADQQGNIDNSVRAGDRGYSNQPRSYYQDDSRGYYYNQPRGYIQEDNRGYSNQPRGYNQDDNRGYYYNNPPQGRGSYYYNQQRTQDAGYADDRRDDRRDDLRDQGSCPYARNGQVRNGEVRNSEVVSNDPVVLSVRDALRDDSSISNARNIQVSSDNSGTVILSGTVATDAEKSKAESIAKSVKGVKSVTNKLTLLK